MKLDFFLIFYIYTLRRLTIAVTPVCHYDGNILTCINVTDYAYEKWSYKSPCQNWNPNTLNINNSNLSIITRNFTDLIYNCEFNEIEITNSKIKRINEDAFQRFTGKVRKLNLSFNELSNLDFLTVLHQNHSNDNNKPIIIQLELNSDGEYFVPRYWKNNLEELNLNNNNLSKIQFDQFQGLNSLRILNLANNEIEFLDGRLLNMLVCLQYLNFEGNKIKILHNNAYNSNYIQKNFAMKLFLQNNPLSLLVNQTYFDFGCLLSTLDLSRCNVLVLENIFKNLTSLQNLKLTYSPLRRIAPNAFSSLYNLNELDLSNNRLTALDEFTFTGLKNLTTLDLNNNPINFIFRAFAEFENLFILNISVLHYGITNNTFYNLSSVREINFINSSILNISAGAFSEIDELKILRLKTSTIQNISSKAFQNLSFSSNSKNTIKLGNNFMRTLESSTFSYVFNVNDIELDNNLIEIVNPGAFKVVDMVAGQSTINLTNNNLIGIANDTFSGITHLHALLISNNKLTTIETNGFRFLNDLEILDLSHNNLRGINDNTFSSLKQLKLLNLTRNKLTTISSNLFDSLVNLKTLVLNNNDIKEFPLGTFRHLSSLTDLYLANNKISQFKIGIFSNLVSLLNLDLSNNNLIIINEIILYPLSDLLVLNLANNKFSNLNYTSLVLHLHRIQLICVNNNNWSCHFLTGMLKTFSLQNINYLFNEIGNFTVENIEGIPCYQNIEPTEDKNNNFETNNLEIHKEVKIERKHENSVLHVEQPLHSSESLDNPKLINEFNNLNSKITIIVFLIFFTCIGLLLLQTFSLYKKYYSTGRQPKQPAEKQNRYSEIELLNTS